MDDWKEFPFGTDFQIDSVVRMVMEHLIKQEIKKDIWDGSYRHGFLMRVIPEYSNNKPDGIKTPCMGLYLLSLTLASTANKFQQENY